MVAAVKSGARPPPATQNPKATHRDGSSREINFNFKDPHEDTYANEDLDPAPTQDVIANELDYFDEKVPPG